ncbi:fatty-acid amide hydrolase 2-like isoform X2 [Mobula hypostoma]|uniref:fatty-acid amide hydrolase 2-like isoform X2 n=1 Tax=Mobula hypostoma TaxID=723540 RepID=UPI002FC2E08C
MASHETPSIDRSWSTATVLAQPSDAYRSPSMPAGTSIDLQRQLKLRHSALDPPSSSFSAPLLRLPLRSGHTSVRCAMSLSVLQHSARLLLRVVSSLLLALLSLFQNIGGPKKPRTVPPAVHPLLLLSGVESARRIRRREVKCVDVIQVYINRIKDVNPIVNALVADRFSAALKEAQQVDERLAKGNEDEKSLEESVPYLGVPFTVKEAFALEGSPNSCGLVCRKNVISSADAVVVDALRRAGAIPLGVTNCSELCMWYESSNNLYGTTRNPYNLDCIAGGSSGGEGCIIAAAGSVMGVGSDIGGSIRMPAFFNGIYGHKPTAGLVPNDGQFPDVTGLRTKFLCSGPMCRYAEDLILMLKLMAGPKISKLKLDEEVCMKKVKFYSMENDGGSSFVSKVDNELIQAQRRLIEYLEVQFGVEVQRVHIHKMKYAFEIWSAMMFSPEFDAKEYQPFKELLEDCGKKFKPVRELVKKILGQSSHTIPAIGLAILEDFAFTEHSFVDLMSMCQNLEAEFSNLLRDDGVFLYPSHPKIAPRHHHPKLMPFNFAYTGLMNSLLWRIFYSCGITSFLTSGITLLGG